MGKIAIVTDSNSGITQAQAEELGVYVIPMPFYINEEMLLEDIDLTQEQFYERLTEGADIHTSTPILTDFTELWDELLEEYDEIVHIPMSSGLSASCSTAMGLARDYDGKVQVLSADGRYDFTSNVEQATSSNQVQLFRGEPNPYGFDERDFLRIAQRVGISLSSSPPIPKHDSAYDVLGLPTTATDDVIKRTYRALVRKHHPDKLLAAGLPAARIAEALGQPPQEPQP